jgi:hypothetical protein
LLSGIGVQPFIENLLDETITEKEDTFADATAATTKKPAAAPVVQRALWDLEKFGGLIDSQYGRKPLGPRACREGRFDFLLTQLQVVRHAAPRPNRFRFLPVFRLYKQLEFRTVLF